MPLTVPDPEDLQLHMRLEDPFQGIEVEYADDSLQRATDLMEIATGLHEDPNVTDETDELGQRLMTTGILAMAQSIYITSGEDRSNMYSPYQSERLGSYSYVLKQVTNQQATGVGDFDLAVNYLLGRNPASSAFGVTSEQVFKQPYPHAEGVTPLRDPSVPLSPGAWSQ